MNEAIDEHEVVSITGIVPVMMTPFRDDDTVDLASFDRVLEHLISLEVPAVMFPGFASEFYKLSDEEKQLLGSRMIDALSGTGMSPILAIHSHATSLAIAEARRWVDSGARALNLLPPHYLSPSKSALVDHCHEVLAAVPGAAVILQYAPTSSEGLGSAEVRELATAHRNLTAVKVEARPPFSFIAALQKEAEPLACMVGNGGLYMLDSLREGAVGVQPGSGFVELYQQIFSAWTTGQQERASELFGRLVPYLLGWAINQESMVAVEKQIAYRRGLIFSPTCRRPHRQTGVLEEAAIDRFLQEFSQIIKEVV